MKKRVHSREFKLMVARQVTSGEKRPAQVCREHNLANRVLDRWRKADEQRGEAAFPHQQPTEEMALASRVAELERFCGQLALENTILKSGSEYWTFHRGRISYQAVRILV
jgi:transposase